MVNQRDLLPNPIAPRDLLELQKDFRVVRKLDSGGFFTVFEAHSDYLGSVCALKIIPHIDQTGTNKQPVIQNELEILNSLKRIPFIIQVLGVQVYFHTTCIMFEFCNQGDLGEMVRQSRIPENLIKRYILDIGTALHHMHRRNIIHRDLKLDNILVDHMGNVKITAFGLATVCPFLGLTSGIVGSPWARAPEMLTRASYNNMVDWWSLGIMLFTMVTGTKPFEPSGSKNVAWHIVNSPLMIPSYVSPACSEVIERLLAKDPALRIGSVRGLKSCSFFEGVHLRFR